jgi:aryl-alcohol dehydrogenase-like predicted oxidoreductase
LQGSDLNASRCVAGSAGRKPLQDKSQLHSLAGFAARLARKSLKELFMRTLTIPDTDLTVSALCFGAGGLGTRVSPDDSLRLLDEFVEQGGNFLDTAHIYAAWVPGGEGVSERTIGDWLRTRGTRKDIIIGTKGGHPHLHSMDVPRLSPSEIAQDLQESLERLQVDTIDLYWLHRDDTNRPVGELVETLTEAVRQNKIRYFGFSNWTVGRMQTALDYARAHGLTGFVGNQVGWSLAQRNPNIGDPTTLFMDGEMQDFHRAKGLMAAAYSSQANGFFAGAYGRGALPPAPGVQAGVVSAYYNEVNFDRLERARDLATRHGCTANAIALGYLISQPFPTCAIVGCGTSEHLRDSCAAGDIALHPEEVAWLEGA